jgi:hypothetical protein
MPMPFAFLYPVSNNNPTYSKRERSSAKTNGKNGSNRPRKEWSLICRDPVSGTAQIRGSVPSHGARVLEVRIHLPPAASRVRTTTSTFHAGERK